MTARIIFPILLTVILIFITYITNTYKFITHRFASNLNYEVKKGEKIFMNEVMGIISSRNLMYIFETIQEGWEKNIMEMRGNVVYEPAQPFPFYLSEGENPIEMPSDYLFFSNKSDHLRIPDDSNAHVIWEVNFQGGLKRGFLIFLAQTSSANTEVVAISKDRKEWLPFNIEKSSEIVEIVKDLNSFKGVRKIYIKFYESKTSHARFYGYMILAETL